MWRPTTPFIWSGASFAIASALLFGAATPLAKLLLGRGVDAWLLAGLLYLGSGIGLGLVRLARGALGIASNETPLSRADVPRPLLVLLFGGVLGPLLLMLGLAVTPAASASLLLNLEGLATMAIAWIVFRESVDRRLLAGAAAILGGAVLLSWSGAAPFGFGALAIAGACLAWGIDNNLTRGLSAADPIEIATIKGLAAGSVNVALALLGGAHLPGAAALGGGAVVGFFGYGVSLVLFMLGLRHLGTARASAYFSTAPFVGAALAVVLFHEPVTAPLIAAGALMAAGLYLHLAERHEHKHGHDAMAHAHRHIHDAHHQHPHEADDPPGEPHAHWHAHAPLVHSHAHMPDIHHRHDHMSLERDRT
jgi:drug/metabolite transporter (DMT)-like permease